MSSCGHAEPGFYALCGPCTRLLTTMMYEALGLYEALNPVPGSAVPDSGGSSANKPQSKSPANDHVISLTDRRDPKTLPGVYSAALTRLGAPVYSRAATMHLALCHRIGIIAKQDWAPEFLDDVQRALADLRAVHGETRKRAVVGTCSECRGPLYAPSHGLVLDCRSCGVTYDVTEALEAILG